MEMIAKMTMSQNSRSVVHVLLFSYLSMSKLITRNCCGIGNETTVCAVNFLLCAYNPQILVLIEPKISGERANDQRIKFGFSGHFRVDAKGLSIVELYGFFGRVKR